MNKPNAPQAMSELINQIETAIPFDDLNEARLCSGKCIGCPKKLLEYLEQEVLFWREEVEADETIKLGDVNKLARSAKKIHRVLHLNDVLPE